MSSITKHVCKNVISYYTTNKTHMILKFCMLQWFYQIPWICWIHWISIPFKVKPHCVCKHNVECHIFCPLQNIPEKNCHKNVLTSHQLDGSFTKWENTNTWLPKERLCNFWNLSIKVVTLMFAPGILKLKQSSNIK